MNERLNYGEEYPRLSAQEVEALIARAKSEGFQTDVDYADIQPQEFFQPHAYIAEIDTEAIQAYKDKQGIAIEEVVKAILEYDDSRLLDEDGPVLPAKLAITIESRVYNEFDPSWVYEKDTVYTLMLAPQAEWEVIELYAERGRPVDADLPDKERAASNDPRALTRDELSLLRLFL